MTAVAIEVPGLDLAKPIRYRGSKTPATVLGAFLLNDGTRVVAYVTQSYAFSASALPMLRTSAVEDAKNFLENVPEEHWMALSKGTNAVISNVTRPSEDELHTAMFGRGVARGDYTVCKLEVQE